MKTKSLMMAALTVMCAMTFMVLTSCTSDNHDNPVPTPSIDGAILGNWYSDVKGSSWTLWNGTVPAEYIFRDDGTGQADVYYVKENKAIGLWHQTFTYTAADGKLIIVDEDGSKEEYTYQLNNGKLIMQYYGSNHLHELSRPDDNMQARFDEWSKMELVTVPSPSDCTVFIYGTAPGVVDFAIEKGLLERVKPLLKDPRKVRVVCLYKYGDETTGEYGDSGEVVCFELTSETDLTRLHEQRMKIFDDSELTPDFKLNDPNNITKFLQYGSLMCPAMNYVLATWGTGDGFDPLEDLPGKFEFDPAKTRGVSIDQWSYEKINTYELAQGIKATMPDNKGRIRTIFFHNSAMSNMESLTELRGVSDYVIATPHILNSNGTILVEYIRALQECENNEDAAKMMFNRAYQAFYKENEENAEEGCYAPNFNLQLIRTDCLDDIISATKRLADRLTALYPTKQEAIDRATSSVYRFYTGFEDPYDSWYYPFFDLADYAHKLAAETADTEMADISKDIDQSISNAVINSIEHNFGGPLDHFTLSVSLYDKETYLDEWTNGMTLADGYEQSTFHKLTGWGNWLRMNQQILFGNPTSGGKMNDQ